ncbi:next to BRCA1 gene 1 protein isoform X2 [Electrophorus electricus]|uniref:next to BRCA1 gene 1 protein isoform X2 n=1 Tax=Electrophorus electricus TaxID=8005 RepID=UPI0015CFEA4F|nr:next to BRCA1 gene 1 protein isoform X2 [Electrophorus electricus]
MDFYISLKVNFRGNAKSFLLSGSETKSWESMEAMVKRSFGLCSLQLTYFDEENEEVSVNSQLEYEEALKSAARQGNRLQMNVYETRGTTGRVPGPGPGPSLGQTKAGTLAEPKKGFRPPQHCPTLAQVVSRKVQAAVPEEGSVTLNELKGSKVEDKTPPAWFTSYMEKFKDQVVREAVEKICREFSGQCCIHKPVGAETQVPEVTSSTLPGAPSSAPACSSCRGQTAGGGYQCSVCTSCTLCEPCSFSHDPSHNLVRARTPLSIPEHGSPAPDHSRFYRRGDRSFRKAEKQRLKAEKRQLKAEVKEIRKQLRMERRGLQWGPSGDGSSSPVLLQPRATQASSPERPKRPCPLAVPAMTALLLDENLPDGSRLRPGVKFIKYWKMKNSGRMCWNSETKLKFMWGNLAVGSGESWREVPVPMLQSGQVGVISVALCAPTVEGTYTSHWRLAHRGEQFGPRVWCSIVVDPHAPTAISADGLLISPCATPQEKSARTLEREEKCRAATREQLLITVDQDCEQEFYIPSVDLLTAQDLLSFELLDINIVQELESVPNNTPADLTPCISPLPQDALLQEKDPLGLVQEEAEAQGVSSILDVTQGPELGGVPAQEKGEEDIIGPRFASESVIRSLTLGEVLDPSILHGRCPNKVLRPAPQGSVSLCDWKLEKVEKVTDSREVPVLEPHKADSGGVHITPPHAPTERTPAPTPPLTGPGDQLTNDEGSESDIERILVDPAGGERFEEEESGEKKKKKKKEKKSGEEEGAKDGEEEEESRSRTSSASSEDYIIILPDCFDTSRPLGESMYSSALSQPGDDEPVGMDQPDPTLTPTLTPELCSAGDMHTSINANDMLCASQTLDSVPLIPVVVVTPRALDKSSSKPEEEAEPIETLQDAESQKLEEKDGQEPHEPVSGLSEPGSSCTTANSEIQELRANSITGGLVKGALSVAASAYKALFTGQPGPSQLPEEAATQDAMMAVLVEMGFGDRALNQRLLQKHGRNLLDVVNELVHTQDNDWYTARY